MKKTLTILFMICVVALTSSCTIVEDARDNREPNIIILTGNYRLFQSNDEINFIKGKLDEDPVKVDSFIEEVGWNKNISPLSVLHWIKNMRKAFSMFQQGK